MVAAYTLSSLGFIKGLQGFVAALIVCSFFLLIAIIILSVILTKKQKTARRAIEIAIDNHMKEFSAKSEEKT